MKWPRVFVWMRHEFLEMLPAVIFFAVGFNVIVLTTNLFLSSYSLTIGNFLVAITLALVVGKAVLEDKMAGEDRMRTLLQPEAFPVLIQ